MLQNEVAPVPENRDYGSLRREPTSNNQTTAPYNLYLQLLNMYGRQHWWPARTKFEVIVGAILTQQTTWPNVELAMRNLRRRGLLNMHKLANTPMKTLYHCAYPTGFYRQKAKRLRDVTRVLLKKCDGNLSIYFKKPLEEVRQALLVMNGIGKETADSILLYAGNKVILPVDAYTLRLMDRVERRRGDYDSIQSYLETKLPREIDVYKEFHALIVEHAKRTCNSTKPRCTKCGVNPCLYRLPR